MRNALAALALTATLASAAAAAAPPYAKLLRLFAYDSRSLAFKEDEPTRESGVLVSDVSYPSPKRGRVVGKLTRPQGDGPFPAVVFQTNGVDDFRAEAVALAQRGMLSLILDPPFTREGGRPLFGCTAADLRNYVQNVVELRRAVDILSARSDVDPSRLGFIGHSYGAQIGGVLSGVEKRIKAYVLMTGGAYQSRFAADQCGSLRAKARSEYIRLLSQVDPADYVRHAAPSALFIQSALHDQFVPRTDALALQRLASKPKTIKWYDSGHELNAVATRDRDGWLAARLTLGGRATQQLAAKEKCLRRSDHATVIRFPATDGRILAGAILGEGAAGVVLAHQSNQDYCGWIPFARTLAARGFRALAFSFRGYGSSQRGPSLGSNLPRDVAGAVKELRRRGTQKVFLIGASLGATAALTASPDIDPPVAGVVDLSGPQSWNDMGAVKRLSAPALFVAARYDEPFVTDARTLYEAVASADKQLIVAPGSDHGTLLVDARYHGTVQRRVLAFLTSH